MSTAVGRKYPLDRVLIDLIPAAVGDPVIFGDKESRAQIAGEGKALVKDQGDAIFTMAGGRNYLPGQAQRSQKLAAVDKGQDQVVVLAKRGVRDVLGLDHFIQRRDKGYLVLHHDQLSAAVLEFLDEPGVVGVEMGDQDVPDLEGSDTLTLELGSELGVGTRPATINQQLAAIYVEGVIVRRMVADVDNVHIR